MLDNSPTLQRWVTEWKQPVPKGRLSWQRGLFSRPFGTEPQREAQPNAKALGYFQLSLRDNSCDRNVHRGNFGGSNQHANKFIALFRLAWCLVACLLFLTPSPLNAADSPVDEDTLKMTVELLGSSDRDMRGLGLQQVREGAPGAAATAAFAELLPTLAPDGRVALLEALGERGDRSAKPAVLRAVESSEPKVRAAALRALGALGGPEDLPVLAEKAGRGTPPEQASARQALLKLRGEKLHQIILEVLNTVGPEARAELLRLLAARKAIETVPVVLRHTAHLESSTRLAAWAGLQVLAGEKDLPAMLQQLAFVRGDDERGTAEDALAAVCGRSGQGCVNILLERLSQADASGRQVLLRLLAGAGGPKALETVNARLKDEDASVREQAWRLLSNWPNRAAVAHLLKAGRETTNAVHKTLALRGIVRLAGAEEPSDSGLLGQAWSLAQQTEDKRLVVGALGGANTPVALALALQALANAELEPEAALAIVMIAEKLPPSHAAAARQALENVARVAKESAIRERAEKRLKTLGAK